MFDDDLLYVEFKRLDHLLEMLRLKDLGFDIYDSYFGTCMCGNCNDDEYYAEIISIIFGTEVLLFEQTDLESLEMEGHNLEIPEGMDPEWLYHIQVEDDSATPENAQKCFEQRDLNSSIVSLETGEKDDQRYWDIWVDETLIWDPSALSDVCLFIGGCSFD